MSGDDDQRAGHGRLCWVWTLFGLDATTNRRSTVSAVCSCYVVMHDKGRPVTQNAGCEIHDTSRRSF